MEAKKDLQVMTSITHLQVCRTKELSEIIALCKFAENYFNPTSAQLNFIANEIKNDFPKMNFNVFKNIILNGIKGKYEEGNYQLSINMRTIYRWIEKENKNRLQNLNDFYNMELEQFDNIIDSVKNEINKYDEIGKENTSQKYIRILNKIIEILINDFKINNNTPIPLSAKDFIYIIIKYKNILDLFTNNEKIKTLHNYKSIYEFIMSNK